MSNQTILWALIILPWITLIFMRREDIKRFMPVGLLAIVLSVIVVEVGNTLGWWAIRETAFPLQNISYLYGAVPVSTIWILKLTYGRFGLFFVSEIFLNLFFAYIIEVRLLGTRGVIESLSMGPFHSFLMTMGVGLLLYVYQIWQEGVFARSGIKNHSASLRLQPATAKRLPTPNDEQDNK